MISIIIPTFNEGDTLPELLAFLKAEAGTHEVEILISDGGSQDQTLEAAGRMGVRVLHAPEKGRARQMNYGAQNARGDIYYFLHADTCPPAGFLDEIHQSLKSGTDSGCFRLSFDYDHPALNIFCWFTQFDVNFFRFGDQSLFCRAEVFEKAGGFSEQLLVMEDQEIVRKLKSIGEFRILADTVTTSARKYRKNGVFRLQFIFTIIVFLYYLKVDQKTIAHFYKVSTY